MNVLILTEGGRDIGFGHITRCSSIYQAFEEKGFSPELIINGDETIQHLIPGKCCRLMDWLTNRSHFFDMIKPSDIVFVDSYLANRDLYEEISNRAGTAVYFDDNMRMDYPKGFVLNGAILAEQIPYPKKEDVTYLLGARYTPLRKEFWQVPHKLIRNNLETIMITFGGADIHDPIPKILKLLNDTYPRLIKKIIVLQSFQNIEDIERLKDSHCVPVYHPNAAEMKKIMLESDIAISAGGQTLCELARMGVPTIAVTIADNQLNHVRGWETIGFVEYAGQWDKDRVIDTISQKIHLLKSKSLRQRKYKVGQKAVDGMGSSRIVREVLSSFYRSRFTVRQATQADARDIFDLANDEVVRKGSFESGPIAWRDHLKWFKAKLADSNCLFFIVDCQGKFAGQIRFDIPPGMAGAIIPEAKEAEISLSLHKHMRGLGLSPFMISRSIEQLLKARKEVTIVRAYIKQNNLASIKCFEEAGFKFLRNVRMKGHQSGIYERATGHDQK